MSKRISPIRIGMKADRILDRNGWQIVMSYLGEKTHNRLFFTDLSHVPKWTLQGNNLNNFRTETLSIPPVPGQFSFNNGILVARLTPVECRIMVLGKESLSFPGKQHTDVTDAFACFSVIGPQCLEVLNKLCPVDLDESRQNKHCAALAPVEDVTCLLIKLYGRGDVPGIIVSGARGYGDFLFEVFMDAGKEYGLSIAGWQRFREWSGII